LSVAISGDAGTIVAGEPDSPFNGNSNSGGAAYVFVRPGSSWSTEHQSAKLVAANGSTGDALGYSVAIAPSGSTIAADAEHAGGGHGAVYLFVNPGTGWQQATTITDPDGNAGDSFGSALALSNDTLVAGASLATIGSNLTQGAAYVFVVPASGWGAAHETAKLVASDGTAGDDLGQAVAISGSTIGAGEGAGNGNPGAAYVFVAEPPVTSVTLSPATPNGQQGWYVSPVHVTVSANAAAYPVTATRCSLDPSPPPGSFGAMASTCPYSATGADVIGDGAHSVYADSVDAEGDAGAPASGSFKLDSTPPTVTCEPRPTFVLSKTGEVAATVNDAGSGAASATVVGRADTSTVGSKTLALTGTDNAGNATTVRCPYTVQAPLVTLSWSAKAIASFTSFTRLLAHDVPVGARVKIVCSRGCPFRARRIDVSKTERCRTKPGACAHKPAPALITVDLLPVLGRSRLPLHAKMTITVTTPNTIGEVFTFTVASPGTLTFGHLCLSSDRRKRINCPFQ
jgi:hypothetical protein